MAPQTLMLIASALGMAGSFLFKDNHAQKMLKMIQAETDPNKITQLVNSLVDHLRKSPAYTQGQREAFGAGARAEEQAAAQSAGSGIRSGADVLKRAAGAGVTGSALSQLEVALLLKAMESATSITNARVGAIAGMPAQRNIGADIWSGALDALGKVASMPPKTTTTPTQIRPPLGVPGDSVRPAPAEFAWSPNAMVRPPGMNRLGTPNMNLWGPHGPFGILGGSAYFNYPQMGPVPLGGF